MFGAPGFVGVVGACACNWYQAAFPLLHGLDKRLACELCYVFTVVDGLVVLTACSDAEMSRFDKFCAIDRLQVWKKNMISLSLVHEYRIIIVYY